MGRAHSPEDRLIPGAATESAALAVCRHEGCGAVAVWEMAPSDSFGEWCDDHVPRGCSCNVIGYPETDEGEQERDGAGRLVPCCEYDFLPDGFPPGDPEGPAKYRERFHAAPMTPALSASPPGIFAPLGENGPKTDADMNKKDSA